MKEVLACFFFFFLSCMALWRKTSPDCSLLLWPLLLKASKEISYRWIRVCWGMFFYTACNMNYFLGVVLTCPFLFIFSHDENQLMPSNIILFKGTVLANRVQQLLCWHVRRNYIGSCSPGAGSFPTEAGSTFFFHRESQGGPFAVHWTTCRGRSIYPFSFKNKPPHPRCSLTWTGSLSWIVTQPAAMAPKGAAKERVDGCLKSAKAWPSPLWRCRALLSQTPPFQAPLFLP